MNTVAAHNPDESSGSAPQSAAEELKVFISAGEVSGDEHAAALAKEILKLNPGAQIFGMGGKNMRAAGVDTTIDSETTASVMGLTEVVSALPRLFAAKKRLLEEVDRQKPQVAVLIDFPDFNFLLAKALKQKGVKILYYISPQLWAWRKGRIKTFKKFVSKVATIFPFEEEFYKNEGVDATYVGHPFLDRSEVQVDREDFLRQLGIDSSASLLGILPGSRTAELNRLLVPMLGAADIIREKIPSLQVVIPVASSLSIALLKDKVGARDYVHLVREQAPEVLRVVDASIVASGTATVEAALAKKPFLVVYKLSSLSYQIAKRLIKGVSNIAMANLIAEKKVVDELIQDDVNPKQIADSLLPLLQDEERRKKVIEDLALVEKNLTRDQSISGGCASKTAELVVNLAR